MALNEAVLALANAVGLIVDRTLTHELVLGQACLVSKGRVVACASSVFNYVESPAALAVKFPHTDLVYAVKTVTLHPDFSRREARTRYLTQTGLPTDPPMCMENDIANLTLEPTLVDLTPDKINEINSFLSLQPTVTPQDNTGPVMGPDVISVLQRMANSGKEGLLTFYDERKRPIARIGVRQGVQGYLQRAIYKMLTGELAVFEMAYRKPRGMFVFQPNTSFNWPNVRDIETPMDKLMAEAARRDSEMQGFMASLGGPGARYSRAAQQYDPNAVHPNALWLVERLWTVFDGYLTLDKVWERIGADTYTTMRAVQEMLRLQIIALQPGSPFNCSGQMGTPIITIPGQDLTPGEPLGGFFLDPLSGRPCMLQGAFQGRGGTSPNSMLHNIPFPPTLSGGLVFKSNQLVGMTSGPFVTAQGEQPQAKVYLMTSGMALGDTAKKLRKTGAYDLEAPEEAPVVDPNMPQEAYVPEEMPVGKIGRFICPNCRALNLQEGFCKKCGADLETGQMPQHTTDKRTLRDFLDEKGITKKHLMMGGGALLFVVALFMMNSGGSPPPAATPDGQTPPAAVEVGDVKKATEVAVKFAGFTEKPPLGYILIDSSAATNGAQAFTLRSEKANQEVLFVVMDSTGPVDHLELVTVKVPYTKLAGNEELKNLNQDNRAILARGPSKWQGVKFNWIMARYGKEGDKTQTTLVGAYKSPVEGKSILVIAQPLKEDILDYQGTLALVENMAAPLIAKTPDPEMQVNQPAGTTGTTTGETPGETTEKKELATDEELEEYVKKVEETLKSKYSPPKEAQKNTVTVVVGVDEDGKLTKIDLSNPSGEDNFDQNVLKLVQSAKYPGAPHTKAGALLLKVTASGAKLQVAQE